MNFKVTGLRILMALTKLINAIYLKLTLDKKNINNSFVIDSYYGESLLIEVNPKKINYSLPVDRDAKRIKKRYRTPFFSKEDWSQSIVSIDNHRKTRDMYELFYSIENNISFVDTYAYRKHLNELKNDNLNKKNEPKAEVLNNQTKIDIYYKKNIEIFNTIKEYGFKSQKEQGGHWTKEIGIAIGENGELYRYGNGYHRMAIVKYLGIEKAPAVIKRVHFNWYLHCNNKHKNLSVIDAIKKETIE